MSNTIINFLQKNQIEPENVIYVLREDGKTVLHLLDGSAVSTQIPLKTVFTGLGEKDFLNIQKGVVVSAAQITDISAVGVYTMSDGRKFQGRRRSSREHQENRRVLNLDGFVLAAEVQRLTLLEKCSVFDNAPIAVCLLELTFNESGGVKDLIFRYANKAMLEFEGRTASELIGHTITEIHEKWDSKRVIAYADVALNGTHRVFPAESMSSGEPLSFSCHQPEEGFCICAVIKVADALRDLNIELTDFQPAKA